LSLRLQFTITEIGLQYVQRDPHDNSFVYLGPKDQIQGRSQRETFGGRWFWGSINFGHIFLHFKLFLHNRFF